MFSRKRHQEWKDLQEAAKKDVLRFILDGTDRTMECSGKLEYTLGRTTEHDVCLQYPAVSRTHCFVFCEDGEWKLKDLHSVNGTKVNGEDVLPEKAILLHDGDVITLAEKVHLRLKIHTASRRLKQESGTGQQAFRPTEFGSGVFEKILEVFGERTPAGGFGIVSSGSKLLTGDVTLDHQDIWSADGGHFGSVLKYDHAKRLLHERSYGVLANGQMAKDTDASLPVPHEVRTEEDLRQFAYARGPMWAKEPEYVITAFPGSGPDRRTTDYLKAIGIPLLTAVSPFPQRVLVSLPDDGGLVTVNVQGWQNGQDVINALRGAGRLSGGYTYRFTDWPTVTEDWGPDHHHVYACACELEDGIYHLQAYKEEDIVCLYGCPRANGPENPEPRKQVSLLDF